MDDRDILLDALKFHGHRCWASVSGVRVGLGRTADVGREAFGRHAALRHPGDG